MNAKRVTHTALALAALLLCHAAAYAAPPQNNPRAQRVFSVHDSNADGYLDRREYDNLLQTRRQHRAAAGRPLHGVDPSPAFAEIDADRNQLISADELTRVLGRRLRLRQHRGQAADR